MTWIKSSSLFTLLVLCMFYCSEKVEGQTTPCPPGWSQSLGHCFVIVKEQKSWFDAEKTCEALDGHLAPVDSKEENDFIANLMKLEAQSLWIGLFDQLKEGQFVRTGDGRQAVYTNWLPGEPNNFNNEDCVQLVPRGWNDLNCDSKLMFVCRKLTEDNIRH